jgi:KTSC domain
MSNKHTFVKSDSMHHCDFDDATNTLKIKFASSSKEHEYQNCSRDIYEGLKAATSPGKYFHANIRNQFKVKP